MSNILLCEQRDGIAFLRMDRPEKRNAFNGQLSVALTDALTRIDADDSVRVAVLTGTGEAFSAGADMSEAMSVLQSGGRGDVMVGAIVATARFSKPVIASVNGFAFGGGAVLAISCDLRVASDRASFRFPGASYGLVVGGSQLPRIIGAPKAKELIFTAQVVDAAEAAAIGLVNRVVPHDALDREVEQLAQQIAAQSPNALRWSKAVIDAASVIEKGGEMEVEANRALRGSPDHVERFSAASERVAGRGKEQP
jgi:enoyl-CoA hydratase